MTFNSKKLKKNLINFFQYISCLCIFIGTCSMYASLQNGTIISNYSTLILIISLTSIIILSFPIKLKLIINAILMSIFIIAYSFLYFSLSDFVSFNFLKVILEVVLFLLYVVFYEVNNDCMFELLDKYASLMYVLGILSILCWLFCSVLRIIPFNSVVVSYWGSEPVSVKSFHNIYFEPAYQSPFGIPRNSGLFTEAAMASLSYGISLLNEVYLNPKTSRKRSVFFILILFSTMSTAGMIIASFVFLYYIIRFKSKTLIGKIVKGLLLPLMIIIIIVFILFLFNEKMGSFSGGDRIKDYINGIHYFKKKIFVGYGYGNSVFMSRAHTGYSNSITYLLITGGLFFIIPWLFVFIKSIFISIRNKNSIIFIFSLFMILIFVMIICADRSLILYIFCCLLLSEHIKLGNGETRLCQKK